MKGSERRERIIQMLGDSQTAIPAKKMSEIFGVSRQVIVQDIALLRAENYDIISTNLGYTMNQTREISRVFKVCHSEDRVEEELNLIVDLGGDVKDIFIYHKVYGTVKATMTIHCRRDVKNFLEELSTGKSTLLSKTTSGYHYHTVSAPTENILDLIQQQLAGQGFLAALQDYEPVDFWNEKEKSE